MAFSDALNSYIEQIGCSAKELSEASGVSPATISRFRSGERAPKVHQECVSRLAQGIESLAQQKSISSASLSAILEAFTAALSEQSIEPTRFQSNFNSLVSFVID